MSAAVSKGSSDSRRYSGDFRLRHDRLGRRHHLPDVSKRFGLSPEQIGNVFLAQAIGLIIASVSVGPLIDNKGKKTGLLLGFALIAIALFAVPNSTELLHDHARSCSLLGLGGGIIVTAANALVSDISDERRASTSQSAEPVFRPGWPGHAVHRRRICCIDNTIALCYLIAGLTAATLVLHILDTHAAAHRRARVSNSLKPARCWAGRSSFCFRCCCFSMCRAKSACGTGCPST